MDVRSAFVSAPAGYGTAGARPASAQRPTGTRPTRYHALYPAGDHRRDVARTQRLPARLRVIGTRRIQPLGSAARTTAFASNRRHGFHQGQPLRHIWPVRPGHNRGQRHPVGIGDPMMLTPGLAAVCGIGAGFSPQRLPHAGAVHAGTRPGQAVGRSQFGQQQMMKPLPHAGVMPCLQTTPAGHPGTPPHLLGQLIPWDAALQDE